jgi:hypothetical protein
VSYRRVRVVPMVRRTSRRYGDPGIGVKHAALMFIHELIERKHDETFHAIDCAGRRLAARRMRRSPEHVVAAATDQFGGSGIAFIPSVACSVVRLRVVVLRAFQRRSAYARGSGPGYVQGDQPVPIDRQRQEQVVIDQWDRRVFRPVRIR